MTISFTLTPTIPTDKALRVQRFQNGHASEPQELRTGQTTSISLWDGCQVLLTELALQPQPVADAPAQAEGVAEGGALQPSSEPSSPTGE